MAVSFTTTLLKDDTKNATGISVPPEAVAALGTQKRPKVKVTIAGYSYRSTIAPFGDVFMLPLSQERREEAGLKPGDQVEVTLELDLESRTVTLPKDLAAALAEKPGAQEAFDAVSDSRRKEFVRQVEEAKTNETRDRRIAGIVEKFGN